MELRYVRIQSGHYPVYDWLFNIARELAAKSKTANSEVKSLKAVGREKKQLEEAQCAGGAVILSVCVMESFINAEIQDTMVKGAHTTVEGILEEIPSLSEIEDLPDNIKQAIFNAAKEHDPFGTLSDNVRENLPLEAKYMLLPLLVTGSCPFSVNADPYYGFVETMKVRNRMVHHKAPIQWTISIFEGKKEQQYQFPPLKEAGDFTSRVAIRAVNTAANMVNTLLQALGKPPAPWAIQIKA
jgi:hypothetical protein